MSGPSATIGGKAAGYPDEKAKANAAVEAAKKISTLTDLDNRIEKLKKQRRDLDKELLQFIEGELKKGTLALGVVYTTNAGAFVAFVNPLSGGVETMSVTLEDTRNNEPIPF